MLTRGIKAAAAGMAALGKAQEIFANNIANINTNGFKRDVPVFKSFSEALDSAGTRQEAPALPVLDAVVTDFTAGTLTRTDNPLDFAIVGKGFFEVETPEGTRYTRSGSFSFNENGELATAEGYTVQGESGPIAVKGRNVTFGADGTVFADGEPVNRIKVVQFDEGAKMTKAGRNLFSAAGGDAVADKGEVKNGFLETSSVNAVEEMVTMIDTLRSFEAAQRAIRYEDLMLEKAVNSVGRIG